MKNGASQLLLCLRLTSIPHVEVSCGPAPALTYLSGIGLEAKGMCWEGSQGLTHQARPTALAESTLPLRSLLDMWQWSINTFCILPSATFPYLVVGHSVLNSSQSVSGQNLLIYTVASKSTKGGLIALWLITAAQ